MLVDEFSATTGDAGSWFGLPAGIFPPHGRYEVPTRAECGLAEAQEYAEALHLLGNILVAALGDERLDPERFASDYGGQDLPRWFEIAEIVRAAGAAAELLLASLCEVRGLLDGTDSLHPAASPLIAGFITEAAAQYLVSIGHSLTNASWRVCLTSVASRERLAAGGSQIRRWMHATRVGADSRNAWLFHSHACKIAACLGTSRTPPARLMKTLARLHSAADWQAASTARDRYFHQLRVGLADGTEDALRSAWDFHLACVAGANCLGRAIPSIYNGLVDSLPRLTHGVRRGAPLVTAPIARDFDPIEQRMTDLRPAVPRRQFRG